MTDNEITSYCNDYLAVW